MDIEAAETAIINAIKDAGSMAEPFPEQPDLFVPTHPELIHLVRYDSASFSEPTANRKGVILQDTRHEFVIVTVFRHLTSHKGIYAHLETLREALTGFTLPDIAQASVLFPVRRGFLMEKNGLWFYQTVFAMTCPESEAV